MGRGATKEETGGLQGKSETATMKQIQKTMAKENTSKTAERKTPASNETLVVPADDLNHPFIKKYLKEKQEKEAAVARKKHLPEILELANKLTGETFKTLGSLVNYFEPKPRAKALTDPEKTKVLELHKAGKTAPVIAKELKKKAAQIYRCINEGGKAK